MSSSPKSNPFTWEKFESFNRTELYQLCRKAGMVVDPTTSKKYLAMYLSGELAPPALTKERHTVDSWRYALIDFMSDYWSVLQAQLKCPAKNMKNPDPEKEVKEPCFGCPDAAVMRCVSTIMYEDKLRANIAKRRGD